MSTNIQRNKSVFMDDYNIKIYEVWNHDQKWPGIAHAHAYVQIWYVFQGGFTHEIEGRVYKVNKGDMIIVPPYVEHKVTTDKDSCAIYGCDFALDILSRDGLFASKQAARPDPGNLLDMLLRIRDKYELSDVMQLRVENMFKKMMGIYQKKQPYSLVELKGYLLRMLANVMRSINSTDAYTIESDSYFGNINEVLTYTNEHITDRIYLKDIAKVAKMSVSSFSYYFKQYTGKTYVDYVNSIRLDLAKTLLIETELSISVIGRRAGFTDSAYFNRYFKKVVGCTPREYRIHYSEIR